MAFRILTLVWNIEGDQIASSGLNKVFKTLTSVLNVKNDQMASSGLDELSKILTSALNVEDNEPGFIHWSCIVLFVASSRH